MTKVIGKVKDSFRDVKTFNSLAIPKSFNERLRIRFHQFSQTLFLPDLIPLIADACGHFPKIVVITFLGVKQTTRNVNWLDGDSTVYIFSAFTVFGK